ncbi:MAG: 5-methylcytosine-specific restriction endonuclease system specificity protein McrC [Alphaproteobacteria bacterium]|nr:5-methylcytosine-specific restriction endonuclease system specificity protein McrC [Alphaproteobacteria bacterium]
MIPIKNIYYMLSYAFQLLNEQGYKNLATEDFDNVGDLCSAILIQGISQQLKRGLGREYISETDTISAIRGKIEIAESIKSQSMLRNQMVCTYDEFSVNSPLNQIVKSTVMLLMKSDIAKSRKKELRKLMVYFDDVSTVDVRSINWAINYNRNNQTYRLLITICYLVVKGLLQSKSDGSVKMMDFLDEQRMCRLYEKFILEYYKKHYPQIKTTASQIDWALDDGIDTMLPTMQSDIMLSYKNGEIEKTLIIDAKYYTHTTQVQYDVHTLHSNNLYQIFTYVKNKATKGGEVSGMLLYAKTNEEIHPNNEYQMSGNKIIVRTLDMNCDFEVIASQLNKIADAFLE